MYKFVWTGITGGSAGDDNVIFVCQIQRNGSGETSNNYHTRCNINSMNANNESNFFGQAAYTRFLHYEGNNIHSGVLYLPMNTPNSAGAKGYKQMYGQAMGNNNTSNFWAQVRGSTTQQHSITGLRFYANGSDFGHAGRIDCYKYVY